MADDAEVDKVAEDKKEEEEESDEDFHVNQDSLAGFVPKSIKYFTHDYPLSRKFQAPMRQAFETVTLFADVSGFTITSVALDKYGSYGSWALSDCLNTYMTLMIGKVVKAGGDIIKFAGDAIISMWPYRPEEMSPACEELPDLELWQKDETYRARVIAYIGRTPSDDEFIDPDKKKELEEELREGWIEVKEARLKAQRDKFPTTAHRAVACCQNIQAEFETFTQRYIDVDVTLGVKLGVGVGRVDMIHVGGVYKRLEFLICGPGLYQAFKCEEDAGPGDIIVSKEIMDLLQKAGANPVAKPVGENGNFKVEKVKRIASLSRSEQLPKIDSTKVMIQRMSSYVPHAVLPHLTIAKGDAWANELRDCTILFLSLGFNLNQFDGDDDGDTLREVHQLIKTVQTAIYSYEGSLNKFLSDDKGSTLMAVFGQFPVSHANDKARAVLAAIRLRQDLEAMGKQCWIGITSGTVFSGLCGDPTKQREFSVLGRVVNLAARLMAEAIKWKKKHKDYDRSPPHILVSQSVFQAARWEARLQFKAPFGVECVHVKGFKNTQYVYKPKFLHNHLGRIREQLDSIRIESVNHFRDDLNLCKNHLMLMRSGEQQGTVVFVEGGEGLWTEPFVKRLSAELRGGLGETKWIFTDGFGDPFNSYIRKGYCPVWSEVFENIREAKGYQRQDQDLFRKFKEYVAMRRPDLKRYTSLVSETLKYRIQRDNSLFKDMSEEDETIAALDLICLFLEMIAHEQGIVVQIYRAHHLRSWDWHLLRRLACLIRSKIINNISLIISSHPVDNHCYTPLFPEPGFVRQYKQLKKMLNPKLIISPKHWIINNTSDYIAEWVSNKMGFKNGPKLEVCDLVVNTVHERCGGRPGFCEKFLNMLKDDCLEKVDNKRVKFLDNIERSLHEDTHKFIIPDSIQSLTVSHFDRISVDRQMILKVASVLCTGQGVGCLIFDREMLEEVHPIPEYVKHVDLDIQYLVDLDYILPVPTKSGYGDDAPVLHGSPLYDYTEVMPDIEYLKDPGNSHCHKMAQLTLKGEKGQTFAFKNDVLYWWPTLKNEPKRPHDCIFFRNPMYNTSETKNPKLKYALGVTIQGNKKSKVVINTTSEGKKLFEIKCSSAKEAEEWSSMLKKALLRENREEDSQWQVRPRVHGSDADNLNLSAPKRSSLQAINSKREMYEIQIDFSEDIQNNVKAIEPQRYNFYPSRTTGEDIIMEMVKLLGDEDSRTNYHLMCADDEWPLYGSKLLWDMGTVRLLCITCADRNVIPKLTLVRADEGKRYSRMPRVSKSDTQGDAVVIKIKFPQNRSHLSKMKQRIDFNVSTIADVITKSLKKLMQSQNQSQRHSLSVHMLINLEPTEWMLRVVGSDIHLFGDGLLGEFPCVREAYDQSGSVSFQLLRIKEQAREAMEKGEASCKIYRFYAFSYGFMRDIIYRQLLPAQRQKLHRLCYDNVKSKLLGADGRGSVLEILQHRHEFISKADMI